MDQIAAQAADRQSKSKAASRCNGSDVWAMNTHLVLRADRLRSTNRPDGRSMPLMGERALIPRCRPSRRGQDGKRRRASKLARAKQKIVEVRVV